MFKQYPEPDSKLDPDPTKILGSGSATLSFCRFVTTQANALILWQGDYSRCIHFSSFYIYISTLFSTLHFAPFLFPHSLFRLLLCISPFYLSNFLSFSLSLPLSFFSLYTFPPYLSHIFSLFSVFFRSFVLSLALIIH